MGLTRDSEHTVVQLNGHLDRQSAPALKDATREIVGLSGARIDIDMGGVDRVDGVGLAALVWAWGHARDGGRELRLMHVRPYVREIIEKMNLNHLLKIVESPTDV
jgi:anti-anti-sigma factor